MKNALLFCGLILAAIFGASWTIYRQGAQALRLKADAQISQATLNLKAETEGKIVALVEDMESWCHDPVMVRILEKDLDHEISGLLDAKLKKHAHLCRISCLDADGKVVAWASREVGAEGSLLPDGKLLATLREGRRGIVSQAGTNVTIAVPVFWQFDHREFIGVLQAVVSPAGFLPSRSPGLAALLTPGGRFEVPAEEKTAAPRVMEREIQEAGGSQLVQRIAAIDFPESFSSPSWEILFGQPRAALYGQIDVLQRLVTGMIAGTALVVVLLFVAFTRQQASLRQSLVERADELEKSTAALHQQIGERMRAETALKVAHDHLELRVRERTAELQEEIVRREQAQKEVEEAQAQLLASSRQAGMAEVATGVLHNVGNVLNSVNVSLGVIRERLEVSRISKLARACNLLSENEGRIGDFLTNDPKGAKLPEYLRTLSASLQKERDELMSETITVLARVDHIKQIVTSQQSYARRGGLVEQLSPAVLFDEALHLLEESFHRHHIRVEREILSQRWVSADKHRTLQILVNLLGNAKAAMADTPLDQRRLVLRVEEGCNDRVRLTVIDSGCGIPGENIAKIFRHGFTTKSEGHGFGLHSCANAAAEMKGALGVRSGGAGLGAEFALELPAAELRPVERAGAGGRLVAA